MEKPIYVTQPYLPPLEEFIPYLQEIWDKKILTHAGPYYQQLEQALCGCISPSLPLSWTALQALSVAGEVITTPYFLWPPRIRC